MKYWALWTLVQVGGRLSVRVAYALAAATGTLTWFASRRIREVTRDHMRHVLGPGAAPRRVDAFARACTRSNFYYYADFARFGLASLQGRDLLLFDVVDHTSGLELMFEAHDEGRGVVMIGGHLGNGEVLARAAAPFGLCIGIVTEPLSPPRAHAFVHRIRGAEGTPMFPADARGLRASLAHLKGGGSLGLLVDRDALGTGEPFPFFGERARLPWGAVELARRTGSPLISAWMPRTGPGRYALYVERLELPEATGDRRADVESGMRVAVDALERAIRRWPGQWFPMSPVWGLDEGERASTPTE